MKLGQMFKEAMANTGFTWLAAMPVAGNGNQVTYVMFPENFASIDKAMAAFIKAGGEMHRKNAALATEGMGAVEHSRSFIAEFQPELSTLSEKPTPPETTRWAVTTYRLKPGTRPELADLLKELAAMRQKAGANVPRFVYWVTAGEPMPAFVVVTPLKTLADLDEPSPPGLKALMTPEFTQHVYSTIKNTVTAFNTTIYMADPQLSLPPKSYVAANPAFWAAKGPAAPGAASSKSKKAGPAAQKETETKKK
jgi:hypothetical protein